MRSLNVARCGGTKSSISEAIGLHEAHMRLRHIVLRVIVTVRWQQVMAGLFYWSVICPSPTYIKGTQIRQYLEKNVENKVVLRSGGMIVW